MHPLLAKPSHLLILLIIWLVQCSGFGGVMGIIGGVDFADAQLLFTPLYFLSLLFIFPNFYLCKGLPLRQTPVFRLLASHALTLLPILGIWFVIGREYARLLQLLNPHVDWLNLFTATSIVNLAIVATLFELAVLLHYLYFALKKTRDLESAALQQKLLISEAELQSFKASVHPHFLFNALNTLSNISLAAPEKAHRFCQLIAEFLRYSLSYGNRNKATLDDEVRHIQNFLGIERERFGERLQTRFDIEEELLRCSLPPLILFPIVENAIKHGIDSCVEGGTLDISAHRQSGKMLSPATQSAELPVGSPLQSESDPTDITDEADTLVISIGNPVDELGQKKRGAGQGQESVIRRLANYYGEHGLLKKQREPGMYLVQIFVPLHIADDS